MLVPTGYLCWPNSSMDSWALHVVNAIQGEYRAFLCVEDIRAITPPHTAADFGVSDRSKWRRTHTLTYIMRGCAMTWAIGNGHLPWRPSFSPSWFCVGFWWTNWNQARFLCMFRLHIILQCSILIHSHIINTISCWQLMASLNKHTM